MHWIIFFAVGIILLYLFITRASREDRLISKYLLRDFEKPKIQATLTATPTNPLTEEEWMDKFSSKNKKGVHPLSDTN